MTVLKVLPVGAHLNYNLEHYVKIPLEKISCYMDFFGYREMLGTLDNM